MCCSVTPGVSVRFSDTVLYAAEVVAPETGETVHVLGYQNKVQDRAGRLSRAAGLLPFAGAGNAMILPFPAVPGTMTRANVLDTDECRDILQEMAAVVAPPTMAWGGKGRAKGADVPPVQVFSTGIYTVVLARDPVDIPAALDQVPAEKRPALNPALFEAYAAWYPGWTVALCCFNNRRARLAAPMLWWYRPVRDDRLFLPALDCHTGDVPDLDESVAVDHVIVVGSHRMERGRPVYFRDVWLPGHVVPYIRRRIIGDLIREQMPNGDFICRLDDVHQAEFRPERARPEGAPAPAVK